MLNVHISLQPGVDEWTHSLTATEKQLKVALVRALNKTARWMRTQIARDSAQALKVRVKDINAGLIMLKARASSPQSGVGLRPSAGVIKAIQLGSARQTSGGVRAGGHYWPHAFIASMPSGHRGVFRRRNTSRLPISEVQLVVTGRMAKIMEQLSQGPAMQRFESILSVSCVIYCKHTDSCQCFQMKIENPLIILYDTLREGLSHLPGIKYCGLLPSRRDAITLPAIFLNMVELQPSQDLGTGELELISHWEAHVLASKQQSKLMLWQLVQAILVWLYQYNWSEPHIGPAQLKQASPDHFNPDYPGEELWLVAWSHRLRICENLWNGQGVIIDTLLVGFPEAPREIIEINHHGT